MYKKDTKLRHSKDILLRATLLILILVPVLLICPEAATAATGSIYGRVIDGTTGKGIPYPYATVELYRSDDSFTKGVTVDDDGKYSFQNIPPGEYKLFASPAVYSLEKIYNCEWYNDKYRRDRADVITVQNGMNIKISIALYGRGSISGRVISTQEPEGVRDVYVYAYDPYYRLKGRAITDAQGRYRIDGLYAGQYKVKFDTQKATRPYQDTWYDSVGRFEGAGLVSVDWERDSGGINTNLRVAHAKDERMKAVVMYGSNIGDFVEEGDLWAAGYLESRNFRVERLYSEADPWFELHPEWDVLADILDGAKIIAYHGHGIYYGELPHCRVGGFYAMGSFFGYPELSTVRFAENPVVIFSGACFTAGSHSAPVSTNDEEEAAFVAMYANDFMGWERGDYFDEDNWRIDYTQPNLGFALYYAGYGFEILDELCSNRDYRLDELIDEGRTEDPYRYNDESDPANLMKEDYRMLLPESVGAVALVGNMNITTKDIIPPIPPPEPPAGYQHARYFAEGCTRTGFREYLTLGNPEEDEAHVQVAYLFADGDWRVSELAVPAGSRSTIDVNSAVGQDKDVSVRVASDKPIVAERPMYFSYNGLTGGHNVMGGPSPSNHWYFAEGYTGPGFDEYICVMNPTGEQATMTFCFHTQEAGEIVKEGFTVPAYSRATFRANDVLGGTYETSLAIQSTQPVVAERPMYFDYAGSGNWHWSGGHCVMGATNLSDQYLFAEGCTRPGFEEWVTLQNPGDEPIIVEATYQLGAGQGSNIRKTYTVGKKSRYTVYVPEAVGEGKDVSVRLTSTSPFLAERPVYFHYTGYGASWTGGHCVIGADAPAASWLLAEGYTGSGFHEYLCLQNPGDTESVVEMTYLTQEAGPLTAKQYRVPARSRATIFVNEHCGSGYQLSVSLEVKSGPPIVVERPMYFNWNGWDGGHDVVGYTP